MLYYSCRDYLLILYLETKRGNNMKKFSFWVLSMIILSNALVLSGCSDAKDTQSSYYAGEIFETTVSDTEPTKDNISTPIEDTLTEQDKSVKAEIAKHTNNAADFRYNRQEIFNGTTYTLTFSKMGKTVTVSNSETNTPTKLTENEDKNITYTNANGDEFAYNLQSGTLCLVELNSLKTEKTDTSIDITAAEKTATDFITATFPTESFSLNKKHNNDYGYRFVYSKYISDYRTDECIGVTVGFDGKIVLVTYEDEVYLSKDLVIDKEKINAQINAELETLTNKGIKCELQDQYINIEDNGKIYLCYKINQESSDGVTEASLNSILLG